MNKISTFKTEDFIKTYFSYLYPKFYRKTTIDQLKSRLDGFVKESVITTLEASLNGIKFQADKDLDFYYQRDPAMNCKEEIVVTNLAYRCIQIYRLAHFFYLSDEKLFASLLYSYAKEHSGIDIHPEATIGCPLFIDHGVGTVIGATSIVGDRVSIYQVVTLGATSLKEGRNLKGKKRHPTIEDDVTLYSYSAVLGDVTVKKGTTVKAFEKVLK